MHAIPLLFYKLHKFIILTLQHVSLLGPITIVRQPQSTTAATGSNVTISITAQGYGLKYLWKKHYGLLSSNIVGQYSPYLNITSVTHNDDGEYYCVVKDHWGHTVKSQKAMLAVLGEFSQQGYSQKKFK